MYFPDWLFLTPGIYTLLVALFAGVIPVMKFFEHRWVKITYAVILGLLCTIEIASITHDRREQDRKHDGELKQETANFKEILLQEQTHFENTMTHFENLEGTVSGQRVVTAQLAAFPIVPNLRTRGLVLSRDIYQWLEQRLLAMPQISGGEAARYRAETFDLFKKKFGERLIAIHGELVALGLNDSWLDEASGPIGTCQGACDTVIRNVADSLARLSSMSGTKSCANLPASQLVEWANTEAKQMSDLANKSMRDLDFAWRSGGKGMAAKSYFTTTFDQCCMAQVVCLRNEFIKRLGPKYKSADEEAAWQFLSDRDMDGFISNPMSVRDYAPYLQNGAEQLTRPHLAP